MGACQSYINGDNIPYNNIKNSIIGSLIPENEWNDFFKICHYQEFPNPLKTIDIKGICFMLVVSGQIDVSFNRILVESIKLRRTSIRRLSIFKNTSVDQNKSTNESATNKKIVRKYVENELINFFSGISEDNSKMISSNGNSIINHDDKNSTNSFKFATNEIEAAAAVASFIEKKPESGCIQITLCAKKITLTRRYSTINSKRKNSIIPKSNNQSQIPSAFYVTYNDILNFLSTRTYLSSLSLIVKTNLSSFLSNSNNEKSEDKYYAINGLNSSQLNLLSPFLKIKIFKEGEILQYSNRSDHNKMNSSNNNKTSKTNSTYFSGNSLFSSPNSSLGIVLQGNVIKLDNSVNLNTFLIDNNITVPNNVKNGKEISIANKRSFFLKSNSKYSQINMSSKSSIDQLEKYGVMLPHGYVFGTELLTFHLRQETASFNDIIACGDCMIGTFDPLLFENTMGISSKIRLNFMFSLVESLKKIVPILSTLHEKNIYVLSELAKVEVYPPGSIISRQGAIGHCFYIVLNGILEEKEENNNCVDEHNKEKDSNIIYSYSDSFGESTLISETKNKGNFLILLLYF
jgi:hypothetical protein